MSYTRAHVDRASLDNKDGPIRFVAASEGRMADGIDLRMHGAQLGRYQANPVVLYGHKYGTREDLPIGRAVRVVVDGDRLLIDVEFDQGDSFAVDVERKYRAGFMNAVSIGFAVVAWEDGGGDWRGGVATEWEMHELSCVPVPMDASAVAIAGRIGGLTVPDELIADLLPDLRAQVIEQLKRQMIASLAEPTPAPEPEPPAPAGLDQDAARALLAAFTPEEGNNV